MRKVSTAKKAEAAAPPSKNASVKGHKVSSKNVKATAHKEPGKRTESKVRGR